MSEPVDTCRNFTGRSTGTTSPLPTPYQDASSYSKKLNNLSDIKERANTKNDEVYPVEDILHRVNQSNRNNPNYTG